MHAGPGAQRAPLVCVVDDDSQIRSLLTHMLEREGYRVLTVADGEHALRVIAEHQPDMVLLDLTMPRMDGFEVCGRLRADPLTVALPVILLTGHSSMEDMVAGLDAGADDFMTKPFQQMELLARMRSAFRMREVVRRMEDAHAIVAALANAVEAKDKTLDGHCRRMAHRATRLAASIGLRGEELEGVAYGALLHDVGKIAMSEELLNKLGPLSDDDRATLARHPSIGERICAPLRSAQRFTPIIRHHHERWDGNGYPDRLAGERIPLGARIVSIADAYDAIFSGRPYRPGRSIEETAREIRACAGSQFDPGLVPIFLDEMERVESGLPPSVALPPAALLERPHIVQQEPARATAPR
jgi:putative two-component system response regulator